jgi:ABC-2 type transport system ATP-binding protein
MARRLLAAASAALAVSTMMIALPATAAEHVISDGAVTSYDGTSITYTLFQPADATADAPVPVVLHSHGWGGARSRTGFGDWLDQGFGVLSFDQRGFGQSGGQANVQDPEFEAQDTKAVIDFVATLPWVAHDIDAAGNPIADDPVLGAIGGSYGGGYQWVTALTEVAESGRTRFNALAPEIAWYDLPDSLAPSGVVRTAWVTALYAAGAATLPDYVHQAFLWGAATGQWPDGTAPEAVVPNLDAEFHEHGPVAFVERGVQLDLPALVRQGNTDTLFNLNQGLLNFERTLTDGARERSLFVGYNGGHVLPAVLPQGTGGNGDPCSDTSASGSFGQLTRDFFRAAFSGGDTAGLLPAPINLATADGACLHVEAIEHVPTAVAGTLGSTTGVGAPQHLAIAEGPITVTGTPTLDATVTSLGADQRVLVGLSVGTSALDAKVIGNQLLPLREFLPVVGEAREEIELPAIAADVPAGQTLFLTVAPLVDTYFGHGSSRTPGAILLENLTVHLPQPTEPEVDDPDPDPTDPCAGLSGGDNAACRQENNPGKGKGGGGSAEAAPRTTSGYERWRVAKLR